MFEVSMIELAVIALVALLVLGPEKLPRAARTLGLYLRKARASWYAIRSDIERELAADDLKRAMKDTEHLLEPPPELSSRTRDMQTEADGQTPPTSEPAISDDAPPAPRD